MGDNKSTGNKRKKMNINHISVSRKKCFDLCAQQYKYRYHLKVPAPGPEPFYFVYGKLNIVYKLVAHGFWTPSNGLLEPPFCP